MGTHAANFRELVRAHPKGIKYMDAIRRVRRLLPAIGIVVALSMPAAAVAAPPERFTEHSVDIACSLLAGGGANAYLSASASAQFGSSAGLQLWLPPDDIITDPPSLTSASAAFVIGAGDASLSGPIELVAGEVEGTPGGTAILDAMLEPDGPLEAIENHQTGGGNQSARETVLLQPVSVAGTLTIVRAGFGDIVLPLDTCAGTVTDRVFFANAPSSTVVGTDRLTLQCDWLIDDLYVGLRADASHGLESADVAVFSSELGGFTNVEDAVSFSRRAFDASFVLAPTGVGLDASDGTVTATAALTALERVTFVVQEEGSRVKVSSQELSVSGSLAVTVGEALNLTLAMNDETCPQAIDYAEHSFESGSQGGNTRPAANDTPETAEAIKPGGGATAHTAGTALDGEAVSACLFDGWNQWNLGHSVWYTVVGNGGPMTLDTGGSDFDTVIAAYTAGAAGLTEVACNDDEALDPYGVSRQAKLTIETDAGVVYYVQIGGYVDQSGHLRLRLD
ncbi:MAG TPA: hypothetical protein VEW95_02500 [Candidatus Limnocylindrales bacterium]|nr:hypothetical protein [Candidatus Limnocylindrales bacterium]